MFQPLKYFTRQKFQIPLVFKRNNNPGYKKWLFRTYRKSLHMFPFHQLLSISQKSINPSSARDAWRTLIYIGKLTPYHDSAQELNQGATVNFGIYSQQYNYPRMKKIKYLSKLRISSQDEMQDFAGSETLA
jgi:hypothetical protein